MAVYVAKFGGSIFRENRDLGIGSVEEGYAAVAKHLLCLYESGRYDSVVAVVSARSGRSNELIQEVGGERAGHLNDLLNGTNIGDGNEFNNSDVASRLVQGEIQSVGALESALRQICGEVEIDTRVQTDRRFPVVAEGNYLRGLANVNGTRLACQSNPLNNGITVVAGYAGVNDSGEVSLLGRNASDVVALMAAFGYGAEKLVFYKDVPGIFRDFGTRNQRLIEEISREDLLEMGKLKVLDPRVLNGPYRGQIGVAQFRKGLENVVPGTVISAVSVRSGLVSVGRKGYFGEQPVSASGPYVPNTGEVSAYGGRV